MKFSEIRSSTQRVMASGAVEAVSVDEIKANSRISGNTEDALLSRLAMAARETVEGICMRSFVDTLCTLTMPCFPSDDIGLYYGFVREITEVSYINAAGTRITIAPGSSSWYSDLNGRIGILSAPAAGWPTVLNVPGSVVIKYKAGPQTSPAVFPVSASVKSAILLLTEHMYANRSATIIGTAAELPYGVEALLNADACGFIG